MPRQRIGLEDYDLPHYGPPAGRDYGTGIDAGYRGGGHLGGDWPGGRRIEPPYWHYSGPLWGPPDRDYLPPDLVDPLPSQRGRGPKNYRRTDERIRDEVCSLLTIDEEVDASDIDVAAADSIVTFVGTVKNRNMKRRAEDIALSVPGVVDVQNELTIAT
jgi:hypothetical protein